MATATWTAVPVGRPSTLPVATTSSIARTSLEVEVEMVSVRRRCSDRGGGRAFLTEGAEGGGGRDRPDHRVADDAAVQHKQTPVHALAGQRDPETRGGAQQRADLRRSAVGEASEEPTGRGRQRAGRLRHDDVRAHLEAEQVGLFTTTRSATTRSAADVAVTVDFCSFGTTYPMPGRLIRVFGSGPSSTGSPRTRRPAKLVPALLVSYPPASSLDALAEVTAVAVTSPPRTSTFCALAVVRAWVGDAVVAPVEMGVPVLSKPGGTETPAVVDVRLSRPACRSRS